MDVFGYILNNYTVFFELIGLLIVLFISAHIPVLMKKYTRIVTLLLFLATLVSFIETWLQTFETLNLWRFFLTATKYTLYPIIIIFAILVLSTIHDFVKLKWKLICLIPLVICIPLYYTSQWTHLVVYYSQENHYFGGPLNYLPYIIFALYFVLFILFNIAFLKRFTARNRMMYLYIALGAMLGVILHMIRRETDDFTPIFTSALSFYFLFLYIHLACVDPLTKVMNRQRFYQDIETYPQSIDAIVSIDMNELKYLNDTYGHAKGDEALSTVSDVFIKHSHSNRVYRVGGDEFIILYRNTKEEDIKKYIEEMIEGLSNTEYSCAFGYSMRLESIDETIKCADEMMYENKKRMKEEAIEKGTSLHIRD